MLPDFNIKEINQNLRERELRPLIRALGKANDRIKYRTELSIMAVARMDHNCVVDDICEIALKCSSHLFRGSILKEENIQGDGYDCTSYLVLSLSKTEIMKILRKNIQEIVDKDPNSNSVMEFYVSDIKTLSHITGDTYPSDFFDLKRSDFKLTHDENFSDRFSIYFSLSFA